MKSVLKYPGAKNRLAPWICEYIPEQIELTAPESAIQDAYGVFIGRYNKDMDIKMLKFRELKNGIVIL